MCALQERKIEYIEDFPFEAELCKVTNIPPHYHKDSLEILLVMRGRVDLISNHERVVLTEGQFFSIDQRDIHGISASEDNLLLQFHLNVNSDAVKWNHADQLIFACQSSLCQPHQRIPLMRVKDLILSLSYMYINLIVPANKEGKSPAVEGYELALNELLDVLFRYFNWFNYNNIEEFDPEIYERMYSLYGYCVEHKQEKITLPKLAEYVHLSQNYISQFMRKTPFDSFSHMIQYIRCYEAEHLMLTTDLANAEVAYECGFSDAKYFYAAFTKWWIDTPAVFRRMMKKLIDTPENSIKVTPDDAAEIMSKYVLQWHLEKTTKSPEQLF